MIFFQQQVKNVNVCNTKKFDPFLIDQETWKKGSNEGTERNKKIHAWTSNNEEK